VLHPGLGVLCAACLCWSGPAAALPAAAPAAAAAAAPAI